MDAQSGVGALARQREPDPWHVRALDAYWVSAAEHILEQKLTGRLVRPSARYPGPGPRLVRDVPGAAAIIDSAA